MLGYGGGFGETWGYNSVDFTKPANQCRRFLIQTILSRLTGTFNNGSNQLDEYGQVVVGDSGGGDFIYNALTHQWNWSALMK